MGVEEGHSFSLEEWFPIHVCMLSAVVLAELFVCWLKLARASLTGPVEVCLHTIVVVLFCRNRKGGPCSLLQESQGWSLQLCALQLQETDW